MRRTLLLVLLVAIAAPAGAEPTAGWKREALATLESPFGGFVEVRDGVWRNTSNEIKLRAQRLVTADGLQDRALMVFTHCLNTWTTARARNAGQIAMLFWPDGETLSLGLARTSCGTFRSTNELPEGAFTFDDRLGSATLDASVQGIRLDMIWFTHEQNEVERETRPAPGSLSPSASQGVKADARRFSEVVATVAGDQWRSDCREAGVNIFSPRTSTCELRSVQYASL